MKFKNSREAQKYKCDIRIQNSPLKMTWFKGFRGGFLVILSIVSGFTFLTNLISLVMSFSQEIKDGAGEYVWVLSLYFSVCCLFMAVNMALSVMLILKIRICDKACLKLLYFQFIYSAFAFGFTEILGNVMKNIFFSEMNNNSPLLYGVTVAVVLGIYLTLNFRYFKKRAFIFIDEGKKGDKK